MKADLVSPDFVKPIGPIMPGGGLPSTLRHYVRNEHPVALGFFPWVIPYVIRIRPMRSG